MSLNVPPRIATWMLVHLMPDNQDEALIGDLLEGFRAGRSTAWYCRQVIAALGIQWSASLFRNRMVLIFAIAWATISPAWRLLITRLYHSGNFIGPLWGLRWPWSTVCMVGLSVIEDLLFIWVGVVICRSLLRSFFETDKHWRIGRAFVLSVAGYTLALVCGFAIAFIATTSSARWGVDWRTLTFSGVIIDFGRWEVLTRLPFLVGTACALWAAVPIAKGRPGQIPSLILPTDRA